MNLELAPQQGNRDTEIIPQLEVMGPPEPKWIQVLLKIKWGLAELRLHPKKSHYQLQPITRLTPEGRLKMQEQMQEPTTKKGAERKEIPKPEQPKLQEKQQGGVGTEDSETGFEDGPPTGTNKNKSKRQKDDKGDKIRSIHPSGRPHKQENKTAKAKTKRNPLEKTMRKNKN